MSARRTGAIVVAIDGPAGAGKSTASRALADRLGFRHIDTGAMYRVVGVLARDRGVAPDDDEALRRLVDGIAFDEVGERIVVGGQDLSRAIREGDAGEWASKVSTRPVVRERLVALQRRVGLAGDCVMEGRDIGTVVFPDAPVKVFLSAAPRERARRRAVDLRTQGEHVDEEALAEAITERDRRDSERATSPLRPAADAVILDTTTMTLDAVVGRLEAMVRPLVATRDGSER
ncbi:MAG TPA: (d)CMP kinase [Candidatus Eisenbacteria bacterium]|nr:(d)CMP kinase [Candidatus Eisenbacteria bacterium]